MQPRRRARLPVLVYCEGVHDTVFMRHLAELYTPVNTRNSFDIKTGSGGSPRSLAERAGRVVGAYEARMVKFDNDRGDEELEAALAYGSVVRPCYCTPCIEATMLEVLEPGRSYATRSTQYCKDRFHRNHIAEADRTRSQRYQQVFPKELLDDARLRVPQLDAMIRIFEEGDRWSG